MEELEIKLRVMKKANTPWAISMRDELKRLQEEKANLMDILGDTDTNAKDETKEGAGGKGGEPHHHAGDAAGHAGAAGGGGKEGSPGAGVAIGKKKKVKAKPPPKPPPKVEAKRIGKEAAGSLQKILKGPFMSLIMRTVAGVMAISLYFLDIISDIQVGRGTRNIAHAHPPSSLWHAHNCPSPTPSVGPSLCV